MCKRCGISGSRRGMGRSSSNGPPGGLQVDRRASAQFEFPPVDSGRWDDVARIDDVRFRMELTRRWNQAHVAAVRSVDSQHPITSEYYSQPSAGIDLPLTIDSQDVSNIGYFDLPGLDIDRLPLKIGFADLRVRGKGVSLGEYGVKTHPAWSVANGASDYHLVRTEEEQKQLFMAVAHYALGTGCSKVQNWCLRDGQAWVFPWGLFYPNQLVAKDVALVHRNQSVVWRCLTPQYQAPQLVVCLANHLRLGNDASIGTDVAYRTFADLLALHLEFGSVDDDHLVDLPDETRLLIYPSPMTLSDATFETLAKWVERGGILLVTGDVSYDENRQRTRTDRLGRLAGVTVKSRCYPNIQRGAEIGRPARFPLLGDVAGIVRPCVEVDPASAEILGFDSHQRPILMRHQLGRGTVYYCSDPIELASDSAAADLRRQLYRAVATAAGLQPLAVSPDEPWLHVMVQRTERGQAHVVYNTKREEGKQSVELRTAAGATQLGTRNRWPAMVVSTDEGSVVALTACGRASVDGDVIMDGQGQTALLSLDGLDLRHSRALLFAPFETGVAALPKRDGLFVAIFGEFVDGAWKNYESMALAQGPWRIELDEDRATTLILICPVEEQSRWERQLTNMLCRPDRIAGY